MWSFSLIYFIPKTYAIIHCFFEIDLKRLCEKYTKENCHSRYQKMNFCFQSVQLYRLIHNRSQFYQEIFLQFTFSLTTWLCWVFWSINNGSELLFINAYNLLSWARFTCSFFLGSSFFLPQSKLWNTLGIKKVLLQNLLKTFIFRVFSCSLPNQMKHFTLCRLFFYLYLASRADQNTFYLYQSSN